MGKLFEMNRIVWLFVELIISVFIGGKLIMIAVVSVLVLGWILASTIETCAYFANEP